jgi:hypothetical protein
MPARSPGRRPIKGRRLAAFIGILFATIGTASAAEAAGAIPVDAEIVIAIDVSHSMDREERALQRDGFSLAFRDPEIIEAIHAGPHARIAVSVMEWAGNDNQRVVVPWTLVQDAASAEDLSNRIARHIPGRLPRGTALGSALLRAAEQFEANGFDGSRRIINISGDGVSNRGPDPAAIRDRLVRQGIAINGLPLVFRGLMHGVIDAPETAEEVDPAFLIDYFRENVIGGPGAFIEPVADIRQIDEAIRRKLIREIRGPIAVAGQRRPTVDDAAVQAALAASSRMVDAEAAVRIAATTWPIAARSNADGPPR